MESKRKIRWWKVVLLAVIAALFLWICAEMFPLMLSAGSSFSYESGNGGEGGVSLYSESSTLYYFYLCEELFFASWAAMALYGIFRCFHPARIFAEKAAADSVRWRKATYMCLVVFALCMLLLILYLRIRPAHDYGASIGREWTTAGDIIFPGWMGIGLILSMDGVVYSLIRRKELKKAEANDYNTSTKS